MLNLRVPPDVVCKIRRIVTVTSGPLLAVVVTVGMAGCGGGAGQRTVGLQPALDAYAAGRYAAASEQARAAARGEAGVERDRANYLAGLSAYRQDRLHEAEGYLELAERSTDRTTAANAQAMLGVIRLREDRPAEAAGYLERASADLSPDDARQAARWTAFAYELTGDLPSAARARRVDPSSHEPAVDLPTSSADVPPTSGLFALQIGAFEQRDGAKKAAKLAAAATGDSDLGPVRVFESATGEDKPRFLVQVGAFNTRSAAASARRRVGQLAYIVAPAADGRILETVWPKRQIAEAQRVN